MEMFHYASAASEFWIVADAVVSLYGQEPHDALARGLLKHAEDVPYADGEADGAWRTAFAHVMQGVPLLRHQDTELVTVYGGVLDAVKSHVSLERAYSEYLYAHQPLLGLEEIERSCKRLRATPDDERFMLSV